MEKLALLGGKPVRTKPFVEWPVFGDAERRNLLRVFESGKWWYGETVKEFEEKYAAYQDAKFGITCVNGTAALEIALVACGIGAGDEVIVPPYTFVATASAVLKVNAIPVFVDIDIDTFNIDVSQIEAAITNKTKAIMPVHFAGLPADMDAINRIAKKHGLKVIEDAAHAWGTKWKGKGAGALGDCGGFSFQMSKNITSGEGGIVLTDSEEISLQARSYSNVGRGVGTPWYEHYILAGNYRMTELQAAILLAQLERLPAQVKKREANAQILDAELSKIEGIKILKRDKRVTQRSYHLYIVRYDQQGFGGLPREKFCQAVQAEGVPMYGGYPHPVYRNPLFLRRGKGPKFCPLSCPYYGKDLDYSKVFCENAERACKEALWLRHSILLGTRRDMLAVARAIRKVRENVKALL